MANKFKDSAQQDFYNIFNSQVEKYVKNGASKPQAISIVSKKFNLSPYKIINTYYPDIKPEDLETYKDIKTEEGSFVTLKNDSNQNHYEVININNKDAIVLRNTDNNEEITASENEITPVITENKMNKLNEAQYNISINGLETQDAATLSQMLNLASQAENMGGSMIAPDGMQSDMAVNPMPMDMDSGMPMDMNEPAPIDTGVDMPMDSNMDEPIVDDIEFDEELPSEAPIEGDVNIHPEEHSEMEISSDIDVTEPSMENSLEDESMVDNAMASDMSMDDMIDSGMYDNIMDESFDYDALIKEAMEAAQKETVEEAEEIIPGDDFIDDKGQLEGEQEEYAKEISLESTDYDSEINEALKAAGIELNEAENEEDSVLGNEEVENSKPGMDESTDFDSEIAEALRNAGIQLDEAYNGNYDTLKEDILNGNISDEGAISALLDMGEAVDEEEALDILNGIKEDSDWQYKEYQDDVALANGSYGNEDKDDFDSEIAEALRIAGVQLDEEVSNGPEIVDQETLYINKDKEKDGQEPEYTEVDTTTFGKDASEGMKKSMTFEAAINMNKIKSIYETAKSMYAKKDTSDWLSLDRRYIEKLIKEGVGYEKASKMIIEAKKGK